MASAQIVPSPASSSLSKLVSDGPSDANTSSRKRKLNTALLYSETDATLAGGRGKVLKISSEPIKNTDYWARAVERMHKNQADTIRAALAAAGVNGDTIGVGLAAIIGTSDQPVLQVWPKLLLQTCQTRQQEYTDSRAKWKVRLFREDYRIRDLLGSLVKFLEKIKQVGDVAVNADPIHAGLPWAMARALLMIATSNAQQEAALLMGLRNVLPMLNRCWAYQVQLREAQRHQDPQQLEGLEEALIALHMRILRFLCSAYQTRQRNAMQRAFHSFWKPTAIIDFKNDCERLENAIQAECDACSVFSTKAMNEAIMETAERAADTNALLGAIMESMKLTADFHPQISAIQGNVNLLRLESGQKQRQDAIQWISNIPVRDHHELSKKDRTPGTGEWIFSEEDFRHWHLSDEPILLWVHGIPGAGKTKLVSHIIDHLSGLYENGPKESEAAGKSGSVVESSSGTDVAIAFFYCLRASEQRRQPEAVLFSFIKQLACKCPEACQLFLAKYNEKKDNGFLSQKLSTEECHQLLMDMAAYFSTVILIVDALDECHEETRGSLISLFCSLIESGLPVKILISSRRDPDITAELRGKANVSISATKNGQDIMRFVRQKIIQFRRFAAKDESSHLVINTELEDMIMIKFLEKSQGMFLWASLHIDHLLALKRPSSIKTALENLPKGLDKTYDELLARIETSEDGDIAMKAFQWLVAHNGEADAGPLLAAVCYDTEHVLGGNNNVEFDVTINMLLGACQNLIIKLDTDTKPRIRFVHLSLQEYCEKIRWSTAQANSLVAKSCILRLLDRDRIENLPLNGSATLLQYASENWAYFSQKTLRVARDDTTFLSLLRQFLGFPGQISAKFWEWMSNTRHYSLCAQDGLLFTVTLKARGSPGTERLSSLIPACYFGFEALFQSIEIGQSTLIAPSHAIRNTWDARQNYSLGFLSPSTPPGLLKLMLKVLAERSSTPPGELLWFFLALFSHVHQRIWTEHSNLWEGFVDSTTKAMAEIFLEETDARLFGVIIGIIMKFSTGINVVNGLISNFEKLVDHADLNFSAFCHPIWCLWEKPLSVALREAMSYGMGYVWGQVVIWLLKHGATIQLQDLDSVKDLVRMTVRWNQPQLVEETISVLLNSLPPVTSHEQANWRGEILAPCLIAAEHHSLVASCELILQRMESEHCISDTACSTSLANASRVGKMELCRLFLKNHANVDGVCAVRNTTPLIAAVSSGHESICCLLLENGADVNLLTTDKRKTALIAASTTKNESICRLLLKRGADVNLQTMGNLGTALIAAAWNGRMRICQLLLDHGADVNQISPGRKHETALDAARATGGIGNMSICRLLIEHGANSIDTPYSSPMSLSTSP